MQDWKNVDLLLNSRTLRMVSRTHMRHIGNYCIFRFDHESFNHLQSIPKQQSLGPKELVESGAGHACWKKSGTTVASASPVKACAGSAGPSMKNTCTIVWSMQNGGDTVTLFSLTHHEHLGVEIFQPRKFHGVFFFGGGRSFTCEAQPERVEEILTFLIQKRMKEQTWRDTATHLIHIFKFKQTNISYLILSNYSFLSWSFSSSKHI